MGELLVFVFFSFSNHNLLLNQTLFNASSDVYVKVRKWSKVVKFHTLVKKLLSAHSYLNELPDWIFTIMNNLNMHMKRLKRGSKFPISCQRIGQSFQLTGFDENMWSIGINLNVHSASRLFPHPVIFSRSL